jgi:hypothetical protein
MAKKIVGYIKLQIPAGKANPSPPVGPALGQRGLNIMQFVKEFNAATQGMEPGMPVPFGSEIRPRTIWSAWRGSMPRFREISMVSSNFALAFAFASATASVNA